MDEKFAEMVRKFPALYNKTVKEFKDKNVTNLIWSKISKELMMQNLRLRKTISSFDIFDSMEEDFFLVRIVNW